MTTIHRFNYIYIYIYIHIYIYIYICICVCVCVCVCTNVYIYTHRYMYIYMCVCVCLSVWLCAVRKYKRKNKNHDIENNLFVKDFCFYRFIGEYGNFFLKWKQLLTWSLRGLRCEIFKTFFDTWHKEYRCLVKDLQSEIIGTLLVQTWQQVNNKL